MDLVAEPKPGDAEEDFTPEAHALFFAPQEFAHVQAEPTPTLAPPMQMPNFTGLSPALGQQGLGSRDGLLSPYCGGSFFSHVSSSGPSSPALSACSGRSLSPYGNMARTPSTDSLPQQVYQLNLASPMDGPQHHYAMGEHVIYQPAEHFMPQQQQQMHTSYGSTPLPPPPQITHINVDATPKATPSKLGHRRAASRGLSLHIPPNTFAQQQQQNEQKRLAPAHSMQVNGQDSSSSLHAIPMQQQHSNPSTPWPQMIHTPTCPPPAPSMLPSPSQKHRLTAIWANTSEDWNKASPALEKSFDQERELSAAVLSSQNMQKAAARTSAPLKRSFTDVPLSHTEFHHSEHTHHAEAGQDDDRFFTSLLGSREY
jgi:hypothetical protein